MYKINTGNLSSEYPRPFPADSPRSLNQQSAVINDQSNEVLPRPLRRFNPIPRFSLPHLDVFHGWLALRLNRILMPEMLPGDMVIFHTDMTETIPHTGITVGQYSMVLGMMARWENTFKNSFRQGNEWSMYYWWQRRKEDTQGIW